jgi:hypothetical protein
MEMKLYISCCSSVCLSVCCLCFLGDIYIKLGDVFYSNHEYSTSITFYQKGLELYKLNISNQYDRERIQVLMKNVKNKIEKTKIRADGQNGTQTQTQTRTRTKIIPNTINGLDMKLVRHMEKKKKKHSR